MVDRGLALLRRRNLRDLAGLPARSCLAVRPGLFFRSSDPAKFGPDEQIALATLGLQVVLDLRTTSEMKQSNVAIAMPGIQVLHLPLFETVRNHWISPLDQSPQATAGRYLEMLSDGIHTLATVARHISRIGDAPFLVCCAAGRDRTGIVVACLLDLLDVNDDAIATDYAQSDTFGGDGGRAHSDTIFEFLKRLRSHYHSTERLLISRGLSVDVIATLRQQLLARTE